MIPAGTDAPTFELPGLVDGARRRIALEEFLGQDVVILAFYPADFNPACNGQSGLDELDLFTMQKDVAVLAVGPDTLHSHATFADEYDLHIPLLSDTSHEVAETYGVGFEDDVGQRLIQRAVFVIDHDGVIQYAWSTEDITELPSSDEIKDAIADTGGDDTAFARYRVGHAHYTEGRRTFTSAMQAYEDSEWMMAQSDFTRAREEFEEAAQQFDSSARFADDETFVAHYERAKEKATALWQAADWLSQSASEYSSGAGAEGQQLREDAERPLENAGDIDDPIDPDDWPPEDDEQGSVLEREGGSETAVGVDIDDEQSSSSTHENAAEQSSASPQSQAPEDTGEQSSIDDAELEEIEAELAANQPDDPKGETVEETPTSMVDAPPGGDGEPASDSEEGSAADGTGDTETDADSESGDIDGDVGEADLEALEAELAANEPADSGIVPENRTDDGADDDDESGREEDGDGAANGDDTSAGGVDSSSTPSGNGPVDPHADLTSDSGQSPPGASRTLEPAEEVSDSGSNESQAGSGNDGTDPDDEPEYDEPQGASDEELADIPTTADLEDESDDESVSEEGEESNKRDPAEGW